MARIFPVVVKRIIEIVGGGGGNGFIANVLRIGLRLTNFFTLVATEVCVGFRLVISAITHRGPPVKMGVRLSLLGAVGTLGQQVAKVGVRLTASLRDAAVTNVIVRPALRLVHSLTSALGTVVRPAFRFSRLGVVGTLGQRITRFGIDLSPRISEFHLTSKLGVNLTQIVYNLVKLAGATGTPTNIGTAWTNPTNALGIHNATSATCSGSALGNENGIELNYTNSVNKAEIAITAAKIAVYAAGVDITGLLLTTVISYNIGAGLVTLETISGAFSNLTVPREYSIPIDTWTKFDALAVRVVCTFAALSALSNASLDAIEVEVIGNKTDLL